jgi:signal transduction histidine kinase
LEKKNTSSGIEMAKVNNVNHKNIIVIYNYLKAFAKKHALPKADINIFDQLGLSYPDNYPDATSYYTDPKQWSPLEIYVKCYLKLKEITGNPNIYIECGRSGVKYKSFADWRVMIKSINGTKAAFEYMPHVFPDWNDTKSFEYIVPPRFNPDDNTVTALYKYVFHPHIDPCDDYCSDPHIRGMMEAIPTSFPKSFLKPWEKLPFGVIKQKLVQYDPIRLFNSIFFAHLDLQPKFVGNDLYIKHPATGQDIRIGKKVVLAKSTINDKEIYTGNYTEFSSSQQYDDPVGTLILVDLVHKGEPICEKGVIMEAPWFCGEYSCQELYVTQKIWGFRNLLSGNQLLRELVVKTNMDLRDEIEEKNKAYRALEAYSNQLEEKVEERTAELKKTQTKLIESEKRTLENRITGGFAHEMRNALSGAQLEFQAAINYQSRGVSATKVLMDSATTLLKNISAMDEKYKIPKEDIAQSIIPEIKSIAGIAKQLSHIHSGVSRDIDRSLAITHKIREYALLSQMKKGHTRIDLVQQLINYRKQYSQIFETHQITCRITGTDRPLVIFADETHLHSIFSNLILNAKDALVEDNTKDPCISIHLAQVHEQIRITVADNGPGIDPKHLDDIFEPFFSTKPTTGTGLGLGIVQKMLLLYDGTISVDSQPGQGTVFTITLMGEIQSEPDSHE